MNKPRRCRACGASLGLLARWCGACGSPTPLTREESRSSEYPIARVDLRRSNVEADVPAPPENGVGGLPRAAWEAWPRGERRLLREWLLMRGPGSNLGVVEVAALVSGEEALRVLAALRAHERGGGELSTFARLLRAALRRRVR